MGQVPRHSVPRVRDPGRGMAHGPLVAVCRGTRSDDLAYEQRCRMEELLFGLGVPRECRREIGSFRVRLGARDLTQVHRGGVNRAFVARTSRW